MYFWNINIKEHIMSFYRTVLAAALSVALVSPVFADDTTTTTTTGNDTTATTTQTGTGTGTETTTTASTEQTKIDLNKATVKELRKVKGLTAKERNAIVAYRNKHGSFKSVDELANVKGLKKMSPEMMQNVQSQLTVD
jgi:competence protein ComEA